MNLQRFQEECVEAFIMECSKMDIQTNPEAKKLAKQIGRQGRKIDKITKMQKKVLGY